MIEFAFIIVTSFIVFNSDYKKDDGFVCQVAVVMVEVSVVVVTLTSLGGSLILSHLSFY